MLNIIMMLWFIILIKYSTAEIYVSTVESPSVTVSVRDPLALLLQVELHPRGTEKTSDDRMKSAMIVR